MATGYANTEAPNPEWEDEATHYSNPYSTPEMELESHYSNPEFEDEATHYSNPSSTPEMEWESHYSNPEFEDEATHYSNPYSTPEMEWESHYSNPEFEDEATHYSNPYSTPEREWESHYSNPEFEDEATHYSNPYSTPEMEWESHYSNPEFEDEAEADLFFKRAFRAIKRAGSFALRRLAPLARRLAPIAAGALGSLIPGAGAIVGPLASRLASSVIREGEVEASHLEAQLFGANAMEAEVGETEASHEAALTEMLAAEAAELESEAEAEALLAAALPLTITIMGGRRALRPVTPILAQATGRLIQVLRRQGAGGRQLVRVIPSVQRRTVATLRAASRAGQPISGPLAVQAMSAATRNVLANPRLLQRTIARNAVLRQRVAPPSPRRAAAFGPGRVAPFNPRRAAGFQPMRATSPTCR